ncbi:MAG: glutamate racemase [Solobacterium sp.]|nr:glutamate racemase [Solobacterium sp.]
MSEEKNYIGIFDSGIGGLTVLKEIKEKMPMENLIYFGDTAHLPYGTKSASQIQEFAYNDVKFLSKFHLKALVIACNTADSVARDMLEKSFDLPIYGVIEPAAKKAAELTKNKRVGVMATSATVNSEAYQKKIKKYDSSVEVFPIACPLLVPLVENQRYRKDDQVVRLIVQEYLDKLFIHDVDTIVLGCTHYPLLNEVIKDLSPNIQIISSSLAAAETLEASLKEKGLCSENEEREIRYYVSDDAMHFKENASIYTGENSEIEVEQVTI